MADTAHAAPHKAAAKGLQKKVGPLPIWGWIVVVGGSILVLYYMRNKSSSSTSASAQTNTVDPSNPLGLTYGQEQADIAAGIDPNTGQTYASEQAATANLPDTSGSGGGGDTSGTAPSSGSTTDLTGLETQLSQLDSDINANTAAQTNAGSGATDPLSTVESLFGIDPATGQTYASEIMGALGYTPAAAAGAPAPSSPTSSANKSSGGSGGAGHTTGVAKAIRRVTDVKTVIGKPGTHQTVGAGSDIGKPGTGYTARPSGSTVGSPTRPKPPKKPKPKTSGRGRIIRK